MARILKNRWFGAVVLIASLSPVNAAASNALERMEEFFSCQGTCFAEFRQAIPDEGLHLVKKVSV